ncbi:hypothetical protein A8A01_08175 [Ewingella americana]|uniref:hypothetical protein n=1 Tax=Rahnella victoriana TaxID=1510570 RepID=UPI000BB1D1E6|nr:hypothetical protein [Rahnella victoriana]PBI77703.1 hypothetical protein A9993_22795 [Rahnella victoriana]PKB90225.1 hypothetical protein A8A01_08175 [Ewingella americana]
MPVNVTLLGQGTITVVTRSQTVTPDSRHFIASERLAPEGGSGDNWYHHWPEEDCGNRLHAKALITLCQHHVLASTENLLVYDSLYPAARGATPLLQSLLCHCSGFSEAWGICSGRFDADAAYRLAQTLMQEECRLLYLYDPLQRLNQDPTPQESELHYLNFSARTLRR